MKQLILIYMLQLINAKDVQQQVDLKDKVVTFINLAEFDLDVSSANRTRRLIVNTLHDFVATPDVTLKAIVKNHFSTLQKVLA